MSPLINEGTDLVMRFGAAGGQTIVSAGSPLTRLNYFDGKFLRADDLRREQNYLRQLVQFSNQGLGAGVVYGMDTVLDRQGRLSIGAGLAMDSVGRTLLIGSTATLDIGPLIDASRRVAVDVRRKSVVAGVPCGGGAEFADCVDVTAPPTDVVTPAGSLYVICVGHAESLCGTEDVYGRLCEEACVTATDRPLIVEGVVVRALPLTLRTPLATSRVTLDQRHLRSLVASAYFEDERHVVASLISGAGLALDTWCVGAELTAVACVPLAVIGRTGTTTVFFDAWTARRERMDAPAKRYWAWRMAMRPWDVFLAQVLQFQCQLHEVLGADPADPNVPPPCAPQHQVLNETAKYLEAFDQSYARHIDALAKLGQMPAAFQNQDALFRLNGGIADLARLRQRIDGALKVVVAGARERVLINGGIVELPSAGYLPVVPGVVTVNEQVRRLLGEGLDLRFCVVRPDYVPHALEEAQHMERISLLAGLDDPAAKPEVDILVPNGDILSASAPRLAGFDSQARLRGTFAGITGGTAATNAIATAPLIVHGAARGEADGAGGAFHFAGVQEARTLRQIVDIVHDVGAFVAATPNKRATILRDVIRTGGVLTPFVRDVGVADSVVSRVISRFGASAAIGVPGATTGPAIPAASATIRRAAKRLAAAEAALAAAAVNTPKPLVGLWATLRSERDPFALAVAESTAMKVEFALTSEAQAAAGATHTLLRVRVFATFSATQAPADGAAGLTMTGHLSGSYSTEAFLETTTKTGTAEPFDVDVTLVRTGTAASGTLRARFGDEKQLQWAGDASWGGQPLEATLKVSLIAGPALVKAGIQNELEILSVSALASADALSEGNPLRRLSTAALDLIGEELTRAAQNGAAYADAAGRLLFPPPPPPVDDLVVRGTLDWVLFHRRRTKRCGQSVPQPVPTPPRRYQLFTYHAKSQQEVDALRRWLRQPVRLEPTFQRVDVLEFASGAATLVTRPEVLAQDWTASQPGRSIAYGTVATPIAADLPLADARLSRVVHGVGTPLDPAAVLDVLPAVPPALVVADVDGIMLLVTREPEVVTRNALVIFASMDGPFHFPSQNAPNAKVRFANDLPQGDDLKKLIRSLTPNQPVKGVTLAVVKAPVDNGADVRIQSVIDEVTAAGLPMPLRRNKSVLNDRDLKNLIGSGHPVDGFDEVIFLEPNPQ